MRTRMREPLHRPRLASLAVLGLALLGVMAAPRPATAHGDDDDDGRRRRGAVVISPSHHGHGHGHSGFVVPKAIHPHHAKLYKPYFHSNVYYAPHRHHHAIYYFPVYSYGVPVYQPYAYCGSEVYASGYLAFGSPRFGLYFGF